MTEFMGFQRPDGSVGVRNILLVIAPIDCSYEPAKRIAAKVDGAVAITQHHGCGLDSMLLRNLVGTARSPNVAGVLIVGLGCESLDAETLEEAIRPSWKPVESLVIQKEGGSINTIERGTRILNKMSGDLTLLMEQGDPTSYTGEHQRKKVRIAL